GIACMVFSDYDVQKSAEFLAMCYKNMPIAFENFTPDGVYAEGPGYCQSGMNSIVYFIASSRNFFGSDFGMSEIDGFKQLGSFPVYITTPAGMFNFGDNKAEKCYTPVLHWYASEYQTPLLSVYQMTDVPGEFTVDTSENTERNGSGREDALSSLWFNREYQNADFSNEPLSLCLKSDVGQPLVLMRSAYLDENATFAGIKGGYNFINHGDLDIGTFVFDSMGERWAEELGPGSYDAPGYFMNLPAGGRWKNYCKRAEGQNTLVINPDVTLDDQYVLAQSDFTSFEATDDGGHALLDMTDAYRMNGCIKAERGFELYNGRTSLKITDNVKCLAKSDIYWFMHTKADISVSEDGKSAILTINGKQMKASLLADGEFTVNDATALKGGYEYDSDYSDIKKLTVHLENVKSAQIIVTLEPVI
ncbi:MAG: heparinase II/III family protein, partial [Clostridia bacterium]|nr:heparinase II/III family protein [Clostridia bacterium]